MKIAFLLHFYQPHDQQDDILERIVNESYRPLVEGLINNPEAKVIVNITGSLTQLFMEKGYKDIILGLKTLLNRGQIEMMASSMYHAILPLIPENEIERQISLNNEISTLAYGQSYNPIGFFTPEMAISDKVFNVVKKRGYKWMAVPEIANKTGVVTPTKLYKHKDHQDLYVFFRNKRISTLVLSAAARNSDKLIEETKDLHDKDDYWFCVMDAETFGHHRIGHDKFLFEVLKNPFFQPVLAPDLLNLDLPHEEVSLRECTWTNTEQDFHIKGNQNSFILWRDPENPIHKMQWELLDLAIAEVEKYEEKSEKNYIEARSQLDTAIASDQFWWASVKPWWSLELIESGAYHLLQVLRTLKSNSTSVENADKLYRNILDKAFEWQRTGVIRKKHLENSSTYMKEPFKKRTPSEWYNQIILEFEDEMRKAAENRDFELAVKWRDAISKLEQGTDIYDVLHVVDELWSARNIPSVKPFLEHSWSELSDYAKKHLQNVMSEDDLEDWKRKKQNNR